MKTTDSHSLTTIDDCRLTALPRHRHENGSLTVVQNDDSTPFAVRRVFYLYDVPGESERGGHSHHTAQEYIIAVSGCFDVVIDDGHAQKTVTLRRPYEALYIPAGIWRSLNNFSSGAVSLVLTSEKFDESDYVRDYSHFLKLTSEKISR